MKLDASVAAVITGGALEMWRNSYFDGEDVRLDGAIRLAPR